jgi:hypothetical protein
MCLLPRPIEYPIKKFPLPTKRTTISLIKIKTYNTLLCVLLLCIRSHIILILRYKILILGNCHQKTLYLRVKICEGTVVIFRSPKVSASKKD